MPHEKSADDSGRSPQVQASDVMDGAASPSENDAVVESLIAGCRRNDRQAQRGLYERYQQRIFLLMLRMTGVDDAADVTQRVFLQVFRRIGQFAGRARFDTWLYRVATNEALQHIRRRGRRPMGQLRVEPQDDRPDRRERLEQRELLERSLERLDPELRSIFLLRELEELSYREIAAALKIPEGTVGSRLNRARGELRQHLVELGWEG